MMMNVLGLCLVVSSLAAAGVWSPAPEKPRPQEQVIVKEGHRVIVVQYQKEAPRTDEDFHPTASEEIPPAEKSVSGVLENAKDKLKEASSVLPTLGQGISTSTHEAPSRRESESHSTPKETMDKVAGAFGQTKEKAAEAVEKVEEGAIHVIDKAKLVGERVAETTKVMKEHVTGNISEKAKEARDQLVQRAKQAREVAEEVVERVEPRASEFKEEARKNLSEIMWRVREVGYEVATYVMAPRTVRSLMGVVHLFGFATAYGMCVWVTFVSSHVLARALPRQRFGLVQSKVYPVYFRAMWVSVVLVLLAHLGCHGRSLFSKRSVMLEMYNLLGSLGMILANLLYFEPHATKVMFERMKVEKEEGRGRDDLSSLVDLQPDDHTATPTTTTISDDIGGSRMRGPTTTAATPSPRRSVVENEVFRSKLGKLSQKLKKLNTYSSFLNIMTLMSLSWHLVYLAQRLHMNC